MVVFATLEEDCDLWPLPELNNSRISEYSPPSKTDISVWISYAYLTATVSPLRVATRLLSIHCSPYGKLSSSFICSNRCDRISPSFTSQDASFNKILLTNISFGRPLYKLCSRRYSGLSVMESKSSSDWIDSTFTLQFWSVLESSSDIWLVTDERCCNVTGTEWHATFTSVCWPSDDSNITGVSSVRCTDSSRFIIADCSLSITAYLELKALSSKSTKLD